MNILIVDDEKLILEYVSSIIKMSFPDYDVVLCESGEYALKLIKKKSFHLIVTDYHLKGISGIDILKKIQASELINPPACLISGSIPEEIHHLTYTGKLFCLSKPFSENDILEVIKHVR